jgi:hypothetical protein
LTILACDEALHPNVNFSVSTLPDRGAFLYQDRIMKARKQAVGGGRSAVGRRTFMASPVAPSSPFPPRRARRAAVAGMSNRWGRSWRRPAAPRRSTFLPTPLSLSTERPLPNRAG